MAWNKNTNPDKIREYNRKYYQEKTKQKRAEARGGLEKECPICHAKFTPSNANVKYCCKACKELATKIQNMRRRQTEEYKEKQKAYRKTEAYKESLKKYQQTEKYKASRKRYMEKYLQTEEGKATRDRYQHSDKFKEVAKKYQQSEKGKEARKRHQQTESYKASVKKYQQSEKGKEALKRYREKLKANGWKPLYTKENQELNLEK